MARPSWLDRAVRNRHRHAIEQVSRRWRGGKRRKILISTQVLDDAVGVARKVADLLLVDADEPTPLQSIVEAELAKVLGASLRQQFAQARDSRAGTLARTLVDPFGVLDPLLKGRLVAPDRDDRVQLATLSRAVWKSTSELDYARPCRPPRHRANAVMGTTSHRWPEISTPSSRRSYRDNIASMACGAEI